jgi:arylsulfatase A-like enzyme
VQFDARITDIAPTALYAAGLPVPRHMEGRVLEALYGDDFLARHAVEYSDDAHAPFGDEPTPAASRGQEAEVVDRLRQLGYL